MPSVPQYNRLGFLEGARVGLESSKAALDARLRREQQAQQERQFEQSAEEEKRRNLATEALSGGELSEKAREFDTGFGDTQARTGLLTRQQAENETQGAFGRDLSGRELGLKDFEIRNQALAKRMELAEQRRADVARESLTGQELTETQRKNLAAEQLAGGRFGLEERAQAETERATREQEAIKGRQLTVEEQDMLRKEALSRASLAEQQRAAQAQEKLGSSDLARKAQQDEEAKRAALVLEAYRERQLSQSGQEFGQTFGLQQRQQGETERRNQILEALDQARANADIERSGVQNQVALGGLDISRRAQTEAETEGQFSRGAKTRQLNQADADLQFRYFITALDNAVKNRQIDASQADNLRSYAAQMSAQGIDLQKWQGEQQNRDASAAANWAQAGGVTPWEEALSEKQRERDAILQQQQAANYPNTAEGMRYHQALFEHGQTMQSQEQEKLQQARLKAQVDRQAAQFANTSAQALAKAERDGDPKMRDWAKQAQVLIKANTDMFDGPNDQAKLIMAELQQYLMTGTKPAGLGVNPTSGTSASPTAAQPSNSYAQEVLMLDSPEVLAEKLRRASTQNEIDAAMNEANWRRGNA